MKRKKNLKMEEKRLLSSPLNFKSMLQEDVDIFLNFDEMGENINIEDGIYVGVIEHLDKDFSEEAIDDTYYSVDLILYLKTVEFTLERRVPGKRLKVNGTNYLVNDWYSVEGITTIRLKEITAY
mgnify:CR=1 FL=1